MNWLAAEMSRVSSASSLPVVKGGENQPLTLASVVRSLAAMDQLPRLPEGGVSPPGHGVNPCASSAAAALSGTTTEPSPRISYTLPRQCTGAPFAGALSFA